MRHTTGSRHAEGLGNQHERKDLAIWRDSQVGPNRPALKFEILGSSASKHSQRDKISSDLLPLIQKRGVISLWRHCDYFPCCKNQSFV